MATTLESFLVDIGFRVDPSQQNRFVGAIKETHEHVRTLAGGLKGVLDQFTAVGVAAGGAAISIAAAVMKIAAHMSGLGYQSERVGAAAGNIHALGYAFQQTGGNVEQARGALESYAGKIREMPNLEQVLRQRGMIGNTTDRAEQLVQVGQWMRRQVDAATTPEARAIAQANVLQTAKTLTGADEQSLLILQRGDLGKFFQQSLDIQQRTGANVNQLTKDSQELSRQVNELRENFDGLSNHVAEMFVPTVSEAFRSVNGYLKEHDDDIKTYTDHAKTNLSQLIDKVKEYYKSLSPEGQSAVNTAGAVVGGAALAGGGGLLAGRLASLMLGSAVGGPVGMVVGLGASIALLANDYKTWVDTGGKGGLIDWGKWKPGMDSALSAINALIEGIVKLIDKTVNLRNLHASDWPENSPFWRDVPEEEQLKYPNSPASRARMGATPNLGGLSSLSAPGELPPAATIERLIRHAKAQGVDPGDVLRIGEIEHGWGNAVSPAGAVGEMQLMAGTAGPGVNRFDPEQNVHRGVEYFKEMLTRFQGNRPVAAAAYNAGPGGRGVQHFFETGDPSQLPDETKRYVARFVADRTVQEKLQLGQYQMQDWGRSAASAVSGAASSTWNWLKSPVGGGTPATAPLPVPPIPPAGQPSLPPPTSYMAPAGGIDATKQLTLNNSPTINVTGISNPQEAANRIDRVQGRQNADMIRRMSSAIG